MKSSVRTIIGEAKCFAIVCTPALLDSWLPQNKTMNKKTYIKPDTEIVELAFDTAILGGSIFTPESGDGYKGDDAGSRGRRGTWGNLWDNEE